jgi:hypothetical protein
MSVIDHHDQYVADVLSRLDEAVTDTAALSLVTLSAHTLNTVLTRMCDLVSQAQGMQFAAIQEAEAAAMSVAFGNRILTAHLAKTTHQPVRALGSDRAMAIWLNDLPVLHAALSGGILSRSHVTELKAIDSPKVHSLLVRDQGMLAEAADDFAWPEWKQIVAYWPTLPTLTANSPIRPIPSWDCVSVPVPTATLG